MQTLISDHVVAYGPWGASLLWFDAELAPHVLRSSSAAEPVLTRAKWAVGAHELQLHNGQVLGVAILRPTPAPRLESTSQESFCSWQLPSTSRRSCCTSGTSAAAGCRPIHRLADVHRIAPLTGPTEGVNLSIQGCFDYPARPPCGKEGTMKTASAVDWLVSAPLKRVIKKTLVSGPLPKDRHSVRS